MTATCPSCSEQTLTPAQIEHDLPALGCRECGGALLSLMTYRNWRDHAPASASAQAGSHGDTDVTDTRSALRCPKCTSFMTKYRVAADSRNQIDLCPHCEEVWLDHGEWEMLERFALSGKLTQLFTQPWQNRVRAEEAKQRAEERWRETFGADYERVREFKAWLAAHPKARELLAYLYLTQTELKK